MCYLGWSQLFVTEVWSFFHTEVWRFSTLRCGVLLFSLLLPRQKRQPTFIRGLLGASWVSRWLSGKESTCQCKRQWRRGFNPWFGKFPGRRKWQAAPVCLLGKSHGQRSLVGCNPWGHKPLDVTEHIQKAQHRNSLGESSGFLPWSLMTSCMSACLVAPGVSNSLWPYELSPPGSSVRGILQARILEWVAMPSSRGSSQPRSWIHVSYVSCIDRRVLYR